MTVKYDPASMSREPEWIEGHEKEVAMVIGVFLLGGDTEMAELVASRFNDLIAHAKELRENGSPAKV